MTKFSCGIKKALFAYGKQITEYEWDDIVELENHILMIKNCSRTMEISVFDKKELKIITTFSDVIKYKVKWNKIIILSKIGYDEIFKLSGELISDDIKKFSISSKANIISITHYDDKVSLYNADKDEMLSAKFDAVKFINNGITVTIGDKKGFYSYDFKLVLPIQYLAIYFVNGYFRLQKRISTGEAFYGLSSMDGDTIIPIEYEEVALKKEHVILKKDSKYGLCDYSGKIILPTMYDEIISCYDKKLVQCKSYGQTTYYIVDLGKFFTKECIKIESKGYSYYLDGKWYQHK